MVLAVASSNLMKRASSHIQAFAEALSAEDIFETEDTLPHAPPTSRPPTKRVRKVSALSDFAPVNQRVTRYNIPITTLL
jgi:hypothetical protein